MKVHPHKLRHTFAVSFLRAGGDVFSLQYMLGHSTLQMTQRYVQSLSADAAINAHKKFSPLDNLLERLIKASYIKDSFEGAWGKSSQAPFLYLITQDKLMCNGDNNPSFCYLALCFRLVCAANFKLD